MKKFSKIVMVFMLVCLSVSAAFAQAKVKPDFTIRFSYTDSATWPKTVAVPQAEHAFAVVFKNMVESLTNGKVAVELFPAMSLADAKTSMEMVKSGSLEMSTTTGTAASIYPAIQVINLPYVFKSDEVAWWVFDQSKFWKDLSADFEKKNGVKILAMGQNGTRHFTNSKKPIHSPADMKGMKFRVMQSPIYVKMVEAMGASATPLAHAEIYTSCQTGVVDGQENPVWNIAANKWYEVQKYITLDGHVWSENMVMINSKFFNKLPADYQRAIKIAAFHGQNADRASEALATRVLDFDTLKASMDVYAPTTAELEAFKKAAAPTYDWLRKQIGDKVVNDFLVAVKDAEKAFGY
ncbi:MAG: DctP family TRAP transporter solute-binding subunit [Treponemataceae bacterium]